MRTLTFRETQVLDALIAHGQSKRMAEDLDVSPRTVEQHINRLYMATGFRNRVKLAVWWVQHKRAQ